MGCPSGAPVGRLLYLEDGTVVRASQDGRLLVANRLSDRHVTLWGLPNGDPGCANAVDRVLSRVMPSLGALSNFEGVSVSARMTPAWIMYVADASRSSDGIRLYEQGMVKDWRTTNGGVVGVVEVSGGSEYKVRVTVNNSVLSYDCDDCFSVQPLYDEDGNEIGQLCVHAAAIAMAAAEDNAL